MKRLKVLLIFLVLIGCVSGGGKTPDDPTVSDLPALSNVVNPTQATRALVIAQAIRVAARDSLAIKVKADGLISDQELDLLMRFDKYDQVFTDAWSRADQFVVLWQRLGQKPLGWDDAYSEVLNMLLRPNSLRDVENEVQ